MKTQNITLLTAFLIMISGFATRWGDFFEDQFISRILTGSLFIISAIFYLISASLILKEGKPL